MTNLKELMNPIKDLMNEIGQYQMTYFRKENQIQEKEKKELVSKVDIESEKNIKEALLSLLPQAEFFGEESGSTSDCPQEKLLWVVDPLDGTTNYLSGLDQFSISIALLDKSEPILGVVYKPATKEIFHAIKGHGLYHNQQLMPKQKKCEINNALLGTGFPYRNPETLQQFFKCTEAALTSSRGIRRFGSAALDLSYVSSGFLQGFWEVGLQAYDIAASLVFLNETGCRYSNFQGGTYDIFNDRTFVAGVPNTFETLQKITNDSYVT
ncbi:MAG: inositol monophosphatase [Planctomycetota bacterium]|nr:MAG: inositol monophosphatase [Planctomycetota bacterium]